MWNCQKESFSTVAVGTNNFEVPKNVAYWEKRKSNSTGCNALAKEIGFSMCLWSSPIHYYILLGYFYWKKNLDSIFTCTNLHIWKTILFAYSQCLSKYKGYKEFFQPNSTTLLFRRKFKYYSSRNQWVWSLNKYILQKRLKTKDHLMHSLGKGDYYLRLILCSFFVFPFALHAVAQKELTS